MKPIPALASLVLACSSVAQSKFPHLDRLIAVMREPGERADAELEKLVAVARRTTSDARLAQRLFAVRCLGVSARKGRAQPEDYLQIIAAMNDDSRAVRWVVLKAITGLRFPARKLMRDARKGLLRMWKIDPDDLALRAEVERLRALLLAKLRSAAPGGARGRAGARAEASPRKRAARVRAAGGVVVRLNANESAAIATLKNLTSAQTQVQASGVIDVDGNGVGEFGYFAELSGKLTVRVNETGAGRGRSKLTPPVLSGAFGNVRSGVVVRSGYCFRIYLPGRDGVPVAEAATGGWTGCAVSAKQAERFWCAYAWPVATGVSGRRAFFVDQGGDVFMTWNAFGDYSGIDQGPGAGAARSVDRGPNLNAKRALDRVGRDGQRWRIIG